MFRETSGESAVPATLITFGIEKALNLVGAALKKAGEDEVKTFYANGNFEGKPAALKEQCVLVLRGQFAGAIDEKDIKDLVSAPPAWTNRMLLPSSALVTLARQHRVYMTAQPDFMFEAAFRSSSDGTAFTLRPLYAALNKPVARPALNFSGDSRHVAIMISLVAPDAEFDADSNPGAEIVLGQLSPRTPVRFQFLKVGDNADYVGWPQESRWFPLKAEDVNGPFTVRVAVTETRTGSALAKFLSEMFEEVKPTLQTEAENRLIAAKGREAKVAEMQAEATLEASYQAAVSTALASLNQCASSTADGTSFEDQSARLALSQKANTDQDAANQAAISAAKKEIPFSGDTMVAPSAGAAVIADCKSKRDAAFKKLGGTKVSGTDGEGGVPDGLPPNG
ncbi:MAG TPA: hypothetical protein VFH89_04295 [Sphingomicrobium sp.]|nr:hypothetical protein [Sphingomicrobium sp.]